MGNKVIEIEGILNEDSHHMARELYSLYNRWRLQKDQKVEEFKELRDYLFATDTRTTTNKKLPWRNSTTVPKLAQIRDNLHSQYMDALFPNDDWLIWEGDDNDATEKKKREVIQNYVKNKAIQSGIFDVISDALYDYIDYGNTFAEVMYVRETHIDAVTGEEEATYIGPKASRLSPYDHVFDPTALRYADSPKFTRYLKSIGELKMEVSGRPDLQFNEETFQKIIDIRGRLRTFKKEDIDKAQGYLADGFGSRSEYYSSSMVELIEFEGDWYDYTTDTLHENRIITIADGEFILRDVPNPNWLGKGSKVHVGWRERPDNLWAMGPLDNLVGLQYRVDHLENLKADALDFTIMPPLKLIGDIPEFEWEPGAKIEIPADGDVQALPPNQAAFQVNNEIAYYLEVMEEMAGSPKQSAGIRTPGEKTAFEVQTLENNAGRIFNNKIRKFEKQFLEPLMNMFLETARRNIDTVDVVKVLDSDFGVVDFITISKDDITAKGKLRPIGARHFAARAQLLQNVNQLFSGGISPLINPHTSRVALATMIEEVLGLGKYDLFRANVGVVEDKQTQSLVNQGNITLQDEATVPVEENLI